MDRMGLDINPQVDMNINGGVTDLYNYLKDYTTVVLQPNRVGNRNVLTQEMVAGENIKYIIKYNYNLDGKNIVFNANTILEIDGGSLTNGGIVGNNTFLINRNELPEEEILINVVKSGTWRSTTTDETQVVTKHRVYLTSDSNGILTQDMINKPNTIYVIKDNLVLGEDITIPDNCVLEFDGGSINGGSNYLEINLNNTPLEGIPKLISCEISNPYQKLIKFSWLGFGNNTVYNTTMLNKIAKKTIDWYVDADCTIDDVITITNRINIVGPINAKSRKFTINAPNSAGLLFTVAQFNSDHFIERFAVNSKYNSIEFTGYAYNCYIRELSLVSAESDCIVFANNFQVHVSDCWLNAVNGCGITNMQGTTSSITRVSISNCKVAYHNCSTIWYDCNGVWGYNTDHWLLWDAPTTNYGINITLINCNIEDILKEAIISNNEEYQYAFRFIFINSNIMVYPRNEQGDKDTVNGKVRYSPIKVYAIRSITGLSLGNNAYPWLEGIYPIATSISRGGINECTQIGSTYSVLFNNRVNDTTNLNPIISNIRPENPTVGYSMFDTSFGQIITYTQLGGYYRWITQRGYSPGKVHGTTEDRPSDLVVQGNIDSGYPYFDETLRKQIFLINAGGKRWVDSMGNTPAKRVGTTAERPTNLIFETYFSDAGFEYFDTDLGKPIYATGKTGVNINWVDATGQPIS